MDKIHYQGKIHFNFGHNAQHKKYFVEQRYTIKNRSNTVDGYYQQRYNSTENEDAYTVLEELKSILDNESKIDFLLNELDVSYLKNKPLLQLSSGEHKRFQLIKALLHPAQLLILDEPFLGLDVTCRAKLNKILSNLSVDGTQLILIVGAHHNIPDCITHILELEKGAQKKFVKKEDYVATHLAQEQIFDIRHLPLSPTPIEFKYAVKLNEVSVQYGERIILNKINWEIKKGEHWLLQGKNGAGKSTLLSLICGDNPQAYANEIYLFDKRRGSGESIWDIKQKIGFVSPELYAFFDKNISCYNTVASGFFDTMGLYRKLSEAQQLQIDTWLKALRLTHLAHKKLNAVSSGMQRLFLLIRALIKNPAMLILDEPCQGLDEAQTGAFVNLVDDICTKTSTTLIYISHYKNEIPNSISKILHLESGKAAIWQKQERTTSKIKNQLNIESIK